MLVQGGKFRLRYLISLLSRLGEPSCGNGVIAGNAVAREIRTPSSVCAVMSFLSAIWAVAHRLCRVVWKILHEGVQYVEQGREVGPGKRSNAPRCWREPFVSSAMRSPSPP